MHNQMTNNIGNALDNKTDPSYHMLLAICGADGQEVLVGDDAAHMVIHGTNSQQGQLAWLIAWTVPRKPRVSCLHAAAA